MILADTRQDLRALGMLTHGYHHEMDNDEFLTDNVSLLGKYFGAHAAPEAHDGVDPPSEDEADSDSYALQSSLFRET